MKTSGVFFLRRPPFRVQLASPRDGHDHGWQLLLGERHSQRGIQTLSAMWIGAEADAFMQRHSHLKAGDCLSLHLDRLHVSRDELVGFVERGEPAPPRWPMAPTEDAGAALPSPPQVVSCGAHPLTSSTPHMPHSIVALATVKKRAQDAARARKSADEACPYPFESAAAGSFKAYYEAELQRMREEQAQAAQPEGQPS
ncbi:hypothetical protein [Pseudacidovorax intermedius]|uniref:hypothetical protein n=1 Tax=Pseudacidovorax intermedius TaxID=433924 RepID=UPI0026EE3421|nr:hypothetical protein [Pseudacidovorax intermedius]